MKKQQALIAGLLVIVLVSGLIPGEWVGEVIASAYAEAQAAAQVRQNDMEAVLSRAEALQKQGLERAEGNWLFVVLPEENWVVTGYEGAALDRLSVPDLLDGADTVGICAGALADLSGVSTVEIPGNVLAIGARALPFRR